jgi:hypothetical protein
MDRVLSWIFLMFLSASARMNVIMAVTSEAVDLESPGIYNSDGPPDRLGGLSK